MKIAVYCGSDFGKNPIYTEAARELASWIGESRNTLVYGGGESGLMGTVITTNNMSDRKEKMLELADAFIALLGGIGTLDEISEAITLTN